MKVLREFAMKLTVAKRNNLRVVITPPLISIFAPTMMRIKIIFLLLINLGLGSTLRSQSLKGEWQFQAILNANGDSLFEIANTDKLYLTSDSFNYQLTAKSLEASGSYFNSSDSLTFNYSLPNDTQRTYHFVLENDSFLSLEEDEIRYIFKRVIKKTGLASTLPLNYDFSGKSFDLASLARGILGLTVLIVLTFFMSAKRKAINWALVFKGLVIQFIFALAILKVSFIRTGFDWLSSKFVALLGFTEVGAEFLFGELVNESSSLGYIFAFKVLPTVIFFSALTSLLFYYGIMQKVVYAFAWVMKRTMNLSGAESLAAAGNIFLGQTESPLLIKPYINKMTRSELLCIMSGGMATIAGGVLAAYIGFLGGDDIVQRTFFAKHLLAASVMSAPAAVVAAKILMPETKEVNKDMRIGRSNIGDNALEAITNGTTEGLKLAVNVGAMLLVFIAIVAMVNSFLSDFIGDITGLNIWVQEFTNGQYSGFSMEFILGYTLAPITWLMGVANEDIFLVGQLLGEKTILNEFVAYVSLGDLMAEGKFTSEKSIIIATYILCGFSNFASIGIQIGGIGSLAPSRRGDLSRLGFRALIGGTMASLFTAVIVGMLI
jgi:CNT family concentrative nucleoside transporter